MHSLELRWDNFLEIKIKIKLCMYRGPRGIAGNGNEVVELMIRDGCPIPSLLEMFQVR